MVFFFAQAYMMTPTSSKRKREDTSSAAVFNHEGSPWIVHGKRYSKGIVGYFNVLYSIMLT